MLISDKIDFKINTATRGKGHYIMIKESVHEDITIVNVYAPIIGVPKYIKQILTNTKGENNTIHYNIDNRDFNALLISVDR